MNDMLSSEEACQFLSISRTTLHRLLTSGELKGLKAGGQWRFRREDLVLYLERKPSALPANALEFVDAELKFWQEQEGINFEVPATATSEQKIELVLNAIIKTALSYPASDIHLEPGREVAVLRFRNDGVLHQIRVLPKALLGPIVDRWKEMTGMSLEEKSLPQDGRIKFNYNNRAFDLRVSTLPTIEGESLTTRVLDPNSMLPSFKDLCSLAPELEQVQGFLDQPHGLVLVVGPTGSGKTTTIYSMLQESASSEKKLMCIEDPVEVALSGVTQVNVNRATGLTSAAALRAFLRHDPDVIYCADVRDKETAEILVQAALTGHLVLSSMHATSTSEAVFRLSQMVDPFLLSSELTGVVSQQLVRRICPDCKQPDEPNAAKLERAMEIVAHSGEQWPESINWSRGAGCSKCQQTGYRRRIAIYEVMSVADTLRSSIDASFSQTDIEQAAIKNGMTTLAARAVFYATRGETTLSEVFRVIVPQTG